MFIVVSYDIPDDNRRNRLHTALKHFGTPVQKSVFECFLTKSQLLRMKKSVESIIDHAVDEVRYYHLCESCSKKIEASSASKRTRKQDILII